MYIKIVLNDGSTSLHKGRDIAYKDMSFKNIEDMSEFKNKCHATLISDAKAFSDAYNDGNNITAIYLEFFDIEPSLKIPLFQRTKYIIPNGSVYILNENGSTIDKI